MKDLAPSEKLKQLSFELLDIGLHTGSIGLTIVKKTTPYQVTDQYIHYDDKYNQVKEKSEQLYKYLNENVYSPLKKNLYIWYDDAKDVIQVFMQIIKDQQQKVAEYVRQHYENVQIFISDNWMRLDFNQDGQVSLGDIKKAIMELYDFMRNYPYYNKATEIKSTLYNEAIKYMQRDLNEER